MKNTPSVIAFVAAISLFVRTVAAIVRPAADVSLWHVGTIAVAWVAVLASALAAREHVIAPRAYDDRARAEPSGPRISSITSSSTCRFDSGC